MAETDKRLTAAAVVLAVSLGAMPTMPASAAAAKPKWVLTDTIDTAKSCKSDPTSTEPGADFGVLRCRGTAGFNLIIYYDDARDDLTVVDAAGTETSLRLSEVIGPAFSSLGPRAEWRVVANRATALTVRFNLNDPANEKKVISYLVVAKLSRTPCVVAKILPGPTQNGAARSAAASAGAKPCLPNAA